MALSSSTHDCTVFKQVPHLLDGCRSEIQEVRQQLFFCFYQLFHGKFKKLAIRYCSTHIHARHQHSELAEDAFADGCLSFYTKLRADGFADRGGSVETVLFAFCLMKLKGMITALERQANRQTTRDPQQLSSQLQELAYNSSTSPEEEKIMEQKQSLFRQAFQQLEERSRQLLIWRKYQKLDNAEIARRSGLSPVSVNNEVFKSMKKLKALIESLESK